jgi:hypothetical protein
VQSEEGEEDVRGMQYQPYWLFVTSLNTAAPCPSSLSTIPSLALSSRVSKAF